MPEAPQGGKGGSPSLSGGNPLIGALKHLWHRHPGEGGRALRIHLSANLAPSRHHAQNSTLYLTSRFCFFIRLAKRPQQRVHCTASAQTHFLQLEAERSECRRHLKAVRGGPPPGRAVRPYNPIRPYKAIRPYNPCVCCRHLGLG